MYILAAASYRYYLTLSETESDKRRDITDTKKKRKRRREHLARVGKKLYLLEFNDNMSVCVCTSLTGVPAICAVL